ncbi:hypothetical protein QF002_005482 [Paraburkholderia youngii]
MEGPETAGDVGLSAGRITPTGRLLRTRAFVSLEEGRSRFPTIPVDAWQAVMMPVWGIVELQEVMLTGWISRRWIATPTTTITVSWRLIGNTSPRTNRRRLVCELSTRNTLPVVSRRRGRRAFSLGLRKRTFPSLHQGRRKTRNSVNPRVRQLAAAAVISLRVSTRKPSFVSTVRHRQGTSRTPAMRHGRLMPAVGAPD